MKLRHIVLSWDFFLSLVLTLVTALFIPTLLKISFCSSFYNVGITVLSIIFSLFFAALAIIMTSSDNDFIEFLEEKGDFTALLDTFKVTLVMLFVSLIYSIVLYVCSEYIAKEISDVAKQHKIFFLIFEFLFMYSMLATALSVKDTIVFSDFRSRYLKSKKHKKNVP